MPKIRYKSLYNKKEKKRGQIKQKSCVCESQNRKINKIKRLINKF